MKTIILVALAIAVLACGGAEKVNADPTKPTRYCTVTFSGAVTGTHDCHVALQKTQSGTWEFQLNTVGIGAPALQVVVAWPSEPALYTPYTLESPGTMTSAAITLRAPSDASALWAAGPPVTTDRVSTTITKLFSDLSGGPCGIVDATVVPQGGSTASGEVKVLADF